MRGIIAALIFSIGQVLTAQTIEFPPRPAAAAKGSGIRSVDRRSFAPERERKIWRR